MDDTIKVTATVTVTLSPEQQDAYRAATGAGLVGMEVAARLRPELAEALHVIPWLREHATVSISTPRAELVPHPVPR